MVDPDREYWRTTRWTLVQRASQDGTPDSRSSRDQAWADLVERYRHPVERTVRYWLRGHPQTEEAVQDFFSYLLVQRVLPKADRERGRFRCFLQGVIRRYVQNWRRASRPEGRGTAEDEEEDALLALASSADAADEVELAEERAWAEGLLEDALRRLCEDKPRDGALLVSSLGLRAEAEADRESLAASAGLTTNALDQALFRARTRLRALVREAVEESVASADDLDDEWDAIGARLRAAHPELRLD